MPSQRLTDVLSDLVILVKRDGELVAHVGGRGIRGLEPPLDAVGRRLESLWPRSVATLIKQLVRRAIADRSVIDGFFQDAGRAYDVRVAAQGPDRAMCVIRPVATEAQHNPAARAEDFPAPHLDRREFLRHFKDSLSAAALREKPTAVAIIVLDGVRDIARIIDTQVSEQVVETALQGVSATRGDVAMEQPLWYMGQLSEDVLAVVLESADRVAIELSVAAVCQGLRTPISVGDAAFQLTPYAGVAILGEDADSPKMLLDHAHAAASEARCSGAVDVCFFTDTLKLRSLARLDVARELREAIANRDIRLRYVGRHDLATGRLVARVGYLHWLHPLRGEVRPAEFVSVAEATGLARALSRSALECLREDFGRLALDGDPDVRISFGALRHHILHHDFVGDIALLLGAGEVPADRLELRLSERTFVSRAPASFQPLSDLGVRLVVDEVGRGMSSFDRLARAPLSGLQLDRSWATALRRDPVALKVCRAGISVATALGLTPIATGIDDSEQRRALLELGCREGMGDLYGQAIPGSSEGTSAARSA